MKNILVTGGSGLLGKYLKEQRTSFQYLSSKELNLTEKKSVYDYFTNIKPTKIVHMAAKVGGIKENSQKSYDFIQINNTINSNVISWSVENDVPIIFISSTCVYPKSPPAYPMREDMIFSGEPEETNDGYAYAKRFATSMLRCAAKQKDYRYTVLYLSNLYGEYDHFDNDCKSHLVTALIKKFHQAKISGQESVELLGTGKPLRQFMYAKDAAKILANIIDQEIYGEFNLSIEDNISVADISKTIQNIIGYNGTVKYNGSLDGVFRKDVSCEKLKNIMNINNFTSLKDGVEITYKKYLESLSCGN